MSTASDEWFDDAGLALEEEEAADSGIREYDITAAPNDFNVKTIYDFIESGSVKVPGFQRHYVWDIRRASKLIESIIMGLPVPQVFLYEEGRNIFLVVDGQQRLMSIYYFMKQRFPRKEKRAELRRIFDDHGGIPEGVLEDPNYFTRFNLQLPERLPNRQNRLNKLSYGTLGEDKRTFELRVIRNIIIKQNQPEDDDSSIFEIFNRLNTGGVNLTAQEIRASLYHSPFYAMLYRANNNPRWRELLGIPDPDLRMKDIEILLRGFAMLVAGDEYRPSMTKFLNKFSKESRGIRGEAIERLAGLFEAFIAACSTLGPESFATKASRKFNISMFEAVFAAACARAGVEDGTIPGIPPGAVEALRNDPQFIEASLYKTADAGNVMTRLAKARELILPR